MWDTRTGAAYGAPLSAGTTPVSQVAFSPDGRTLVSANVGSAVVWNMDGEQAIGKPLGGPADLITDVAFSPDGRWLAAGRFDGDTTVYDAATRRAVRRIGGSSIVSAVAFSPDGSLIVVATIDGKVAFFDRTSGAAVGRAVDAGPAAVWQVAFSPDGRLLAVAVDPNGVQGFGRQRRQGEVQLWDVRSRAEWAGRSGRAPARCCRLPSAATAGCSRPGATRGQLDLWDVAGPVAPR